MAYSRSDVETHGGGYDQDGAWSWTPAVNVKVHAWTPDHIEAAKQVERDEEAPGFAAWYERWLDAHEDVYWPFEAACEQGWEQLQTDAEEIWGSARGEYGYYNRPVKVESEGRSGGWAVVRGLPDLDEWDAVMLAKWRRFERYAKQVVAGIPYDMAWLVHANVFEPSEARSMTGPSMVGAGL